MDRSPDRHLAGRAVGGLVVAGALAALWRSQPHRARRGPGRATPVSAWLLGPLAASWLAAGVVDSITGALGGLLSKPVDWAKAAIQGVVSWITDWVNHVIDWASGAFDAINGVLGRLWDFGNSIVTWAAGQVKGAFDSLVSWVGRLVTDARNFASGIVNQLGDWAERAINDLWSYGRSIVDWVNRNIWQPLSDRIEGAFNWVTGTVIPWVRGIVDDVAGWARSAFDHVWGWLGDVVSPFISWATFLLHAVEKALGWIVWVGEHPIDWVRGLWQSWTHWDSRSATASMIDAVTQEADLVADHLVRWLG